MRIRYNILIFTVLTLTACSEQDFFPQTDDVNREIMFTATVADTWEYSVLSRAITEQNAIATPLTTKSNYGQQLYIHQTIQPRGDKQKVRTRADLINYPLDFPDNTVFGVSAYQHTSGQNMANIPPNFFYNAPAEKGGSVNTYKTSDSYYWPGGNNLLDFYAYYPYNNASGSNDITIQNVAGPMTIEYKSNSDVTAQTDFMTAVQLNQTFNNKGGLTLPFTHPLTAINFVLGDDVAAGYIQKIWFEDIYTEGTYIVGSGWDFTGKAYNTYTMDFTNNGNSSGITTPQEGLELNPDENTLLMIPQKFNSDNENPMLHVDMKLQSDGNEYTLTAHLKGTEWKEGTLVTYIITTSNVNFANVKTVNYPTDWDGETFSLKNTYAEKDEVGIFSVDKTTGEIKESNMKYVLKNGVWKAQGTSNLHYYNNCTYYMYYPYQTTVPSTMAQGAFVTPDTDEDTFFADLINSWTTGTNQSNASTLCAYDLQIGKTDGSSSLLTFNMKHELSLAVLYLETTNIKKAKWYKYQADGTEDESTARVSNDYTTASASNKFGNIKPCYSGTSYKYYYILKDGESVTFTSTATGNDAWVPNAVSFTGEAGRRIPGTANLATNISSLEYWYKGWYFDYSGTVVTFTAPETCEYQLEVWGAQGGVNKNNSAGGAGGYAYGNINLTEQQELYVVVGARPSTYYIGGYNGGGHDSAAGGRGYAGGGGGATHIAFNQNLGILRNYLNAKNDILIVAGGGGGRSEYGNAGGTGGGTNGGNGSGRYLGYGGLQTGPGSNSSYSGGGNVGGFGYGGDGEHLYTASSSRCYGGGGGGGWYGGTGGGWSTTASYSGGGGGGSGHINENFLSSYGMSNGQRTGNGYACITLLKPVQ